jgi:glycerate kinase
VSAKPGAGQADILTRIDGATAKLAQAQGQAETYLEKISEVLAEAHQEFSDNMRKTLTVQGNSAAVGLGWRLRWLH